MDPSLDLSQKDLAWIGDAVLALYAREWLLREPEHPVFSRQDRFLWFTSNAFLQALGDPTAVEAEIGHWYRSQGLAAAYRHIESTLLPLFQRQLRNRSRGQRGRKG
ncbi:MAG: hypothetical protein GVY10_09820 [Verrucomicrobia bacterium]|jgi:dsRNA-specific ribonuclease|nr:hypothetical protein [Verrucomicrobiota bacterium]